MTAGVALFVINSLIIGQINELADEIWELTCEGNSCLSGKDQSKLDEMKKNFTKSPAPPRSLPLSASVQLVVLQSCSRSQCTAQTVTADRDFSSRR